jgi:menaquinone-specific isochorismate synthase
VPTTAVTTERLGEHPGLSHIDLGMEISASWIRGGDGLIGFGVHARTTVSGKNRFNDARAWWKSQLASYEIRNNVRGSGTGPLLFASFAFNEDEPTELVIPEVIIGRKNGESWITWFGEKPHPTLAQAAPATNHPAITWRAGSLDDSIWKARVASAVEKINSGALDKVVLARDLIAESDSPVSIRPIIHNLESKYPSTWVFTVAGLVGATPELLARLSKSLVTSRVLAGTIRMTGDEEKDLALAGSLAKSSKDLEEHEYAVRSVADALAPYCSSTNVPESPFVLHLANVMHLATDVTGVVNESAAPVDIFTVISSLHPSAAVCGTPTDVARTLINELEAMNRSRYAGPVGWVDARGDGEMGIALRCGLISDDARSVRTFAGCGIVAGSVPEDELAESQAKLSPMRTALETL